MHSDLTGGLGPSVLLSLQHLAVHVLQHGGRVLRSERAREPVVEAPSVRAVVAGAQILSACHTIEMASRNQKQFESQGSQCLRWVG